ncbi:PAS domain-containing protein [Novosphingobium sp. BL-8A]|uniref:hybrid sensor histidine kinase/response regulator n=1 Tax=Novosphingobium sp. BL-8A TaxID=3127639 RepID=UPI0037572B64
MSDSSISLLPVAPGASGTWDWDIAADRLTVDACFAELYDIDSEEAAAGLPTGAFFKAIHPDDRPRMRIAVAGILAGAEFFSKEFRVIAPDRAILWMHARGHAHFDENDAPVRFTGLLVDVTERKRTEERLRVAQSAGGIGTFEYIDGFATAAVSDEFCWLLGLHPAPILPVQTINSVRLGDGDRIIPDPGDAMTGDSIDAEFQIARRDDGRHRWIARRGEIAREGTGYRLIGVIYDITAAKEQEAALRELNDNLESRVEQEVAIRRQAEEALRQAQKMEAIGQLTGGIAHDFNNLLMAITSSLELLRKRASLDENALRLIDNAKQGADRGAALTQRMLAFARRQDLSTEHVDVQTLVTGFRELIERTLGPPWRLELAIPAGLPQVLVDTNQLEMALLNLVVNARDAMPAGGSVCIEACLKQVAHGEMTDLPAGSFVKLAVVDTGHGMDRETLARATEPFFTTKGVGKGTGLGLSMIHGFAKQLGGGFMIESIPQEGTTATLWIPVAQSAATAPAPSTANIPAPIAERKLKIVAVDDDGLILMNTSAMLEDLGHQVFEAHSGQLALDLLRKIPDVDLLITDQAMPNMTGTQLADLATELQSGLPIILASGYGELPEGAQQRMVKLGKPFSQRDLELAIEQAIGSSARSS